LPEQRVYNAFLEINRLYDYINVRDRHSSHVLSHYQLACDIGADLAYALDINDRKIHEDLSDVVLVTVREGLVIDPSLKGCSRPSRTFAIGIGSVHG
jgi:hypothetical protein